MVNRLALSLEPTKIFLGYHNFRATLAVSTSCDTPMYPDVLNLACTCELSLKCSLSMPLAMATQNAIHWLIVLTCECKQLKKVSVISSFAVFLRLIALKVLR